MGRTIMLYYSTNKALKTICKIREENRKKYTRQMNEWNELSQIVLENWDDIYLNAQFIEGETDNLGIAVGCVEADYYAPERIYVRFTTKEDPYGLKHWVELHQSVGVKYIDGVRNYDSKNKKFTPKQIIGVNLEVAKRAICVLGMKRELV